MGGHADKPFKGIQGFFLFLSDDTSYEKLSYGIYARDPGSADGVASIIIDIAADQQYPFRSLSEMNAGLRRAGGRPPHQKHYTDAGGGSAYDCTEQEKQVLND